MNDTRNQSRRAVVSGVLGTLALAGCSDGSSGAAVTGGATAAPSASGPSTASSPSSPASSVPAPATSSPSATVPTGPPAIARTPGPDITTGPIGRGELTLTFHGAGSADITQGVIDALAAADAKATIFAVGLWVAKDPAQVRALRDAGHEIGNHTYDHLDMLGLDAATARDQIARGQDILASTLGDPGWWFRPSGTSHSNETIRAAAVELGYGPCVSYDVDPEDFRDPGAALVASRTLAAAQAGSIVSLHLGHPGTVTALPGILSTLAERGLKAVTLTTLLRDSPGHPTP